MKNLIAWVEIPTEKMNRAVDFYSEVFKWDLKTIDFGTEKMALLPENAGAIAQSPGFEPASGGVLVSLQVKDINATLSDVEQNGGKVVKPVTAIEREEGGYFAVFTDSEGNQLGLFSAETETA
ncbi:MAG TPA: VOC family protein [Bacteroidales bacterium]|nr:VOC family protein [Bacteroidales bacterium]